MRELWDRVRKAYVRHLWLILALSALTVVFLLVLLYGWGRARNQAPALEIPILTIEAPALLVTAEQIERLTYTDSVLGELRWHLDQESLLDLNRVLREYGICQPEEISQFLAQVTVETGAGQRLTESGDEAYFQSRGYSTGTRGAGYLHLTYEYGQMAFSVWMMKRYVPELEGIDYINPSNHAEAEIAAAYYGALRLAANLGVDVSRYSRIVFDGQSPVTTGADYIAQTFAWESAGYFWHIAGIQEILASAPGAGYVDLVSERVGGSNWQSRREAYMAFYPVLSNEIP